ncbi:MAG TPA: FAD:protein FMN transferase [Segeticoccus sp.]|uniref:FAD:protein FMN transferase n=1 Tax=Segeticoccus sp. TaxID=2706531 RepID=UPI002D7ED418|nr:FAD:protein FMN transferase [Segeticoccus sp.]HET8601013.1 FAD:protein FMN transferase [Segeticoccus sp.]
MTATPTRARSRAAVQWDLWTMTARLVVDDGAALAEATRLLNAHLAAIEDAASRFRTDSEVCRLAASPVERHEVSRLLGDMLAAALDAAEVSGGRVDPTVGTVLSALARPAPAVRASMRRRATWRDVQVQETVVRMPPGTLLDLGATGKAFAVDRAAQMLARELGCGVLVSLGGDLRTAGEPRAPWTVLVRDGKDEPATVVDLAADAAVATSSSLHRTTGPDLAPHVIDPLSGHSVGKLWRTVTVAAETCVEANTWSTAALVAGADAPDLLASTGLPARLVAADGSVHYLGEWPR